MRDQRIAKLREMAATGYSDAEMGEAFGVTSRTILRWRKAARIPSGWVPPEPAPTQHGTPNAYRRRKCRCTPCIRANRRAQGDFLDRVQRETGRNAVHHGEPWTPADDAVVRMRPPLEAALDLGRTYAAVTQRARVLNERMRVQRALNALRSSQEAATTS